MKRTFLISLLLLLLLFLPLVGCSAKQPEQTTTVATEEVTKAPFDLENYKSNVSACVSRIDEEAIIVYNVAKKEHDYMETFEKISGKNADSDSAKETAYKWLTEKSDYSAETVEAGYAEIVKMYKAIIALDVEGTEAEEIRSEFDDYATAYINLYNLALDPSGSAYSFGASCDECISALRTGKNILSILLS